MEAAAVKAWAVHFKKDFAKSLQSFEQIYCHWKATNASSYAAFLMNYSNCLISSCLVSESKDILSEALDACNDYAQAQDISIRLLLNATKGSLIADTKLPSSYANEHRPKAAPKTRAKKRVNGKQTLRDNTNIDWKLVLKKSNLRC